MRWSFPSILFVSLVGLPGQDAAFTTPTTNPQVRLGSMGLHMADDRDPTMDAFNEALRKAVPRPQAKASSPAQVQAQTQPEAAIPPPPEPAQQIFQAGAAAQAQEQVVTPRHLPIVPPDEEPPSKVSRNLGVPTYATHPYEDASFSSLDLNKPINAFSFTQQEELRRIRAKAQDAEVVDDANAVPTGRKSMEQQVDHAAEEFIKEMQKQLKMQKEEEQKRQQEQAQKPLFPQNLPWQQKQPQEPAFPQSWTQPPPEEYTLRREAFASATLSTNNEVDRAHIWKSENDDSLFQNPHSHQSMENATDARIRQQFETMSPEDVIATVQQQQNQYQQQQAAQQWNSPPQPVQPHYPNSNNAEAIPSIAFAKMHHDYVKALNNNGHETNEVHDNNNHNMGQTNNGLQHHDQLNGFPNNGQPNNNGFQQNNDSGGWTQQHERVINHNHNNNNGYYPNGYQAPHQPRVQNNHNGQGYGAWQPQVSTMEMPMNEHPLPAIEPVEVADQEEADSSTTNAFRAQGAMDTPKESDTESATNQESTAETKLEATIEQNMEQMDPEMVVPPVPDLGASPASQAQPKAQILSGNSFTKETWKAASENQRPEKESEKLQGVNAKKDDQAKTTTTLKNPLSGMMGHFGGTKPTASQEKKESSVLTSQVSDQANKLNEKVALKNPLAEMMGNFRFGGSMPTGDAKAKKEDPPAAKKEEKKHTEDENLNSSLTGMMDQLHLAEKPSHVEGNKNIAFSHVPKADSSEDSHRKDSNALKNALSGRMGSFQIGTSKTVHTPEEKSPTQSIQKAESSTKKEGPKDAGAAKSAHPTAGIKGSSQSDGAKSKNLEASVTKDQIQRPEETINNTPDGTMENNLAGGNNLNHLHNSQEPGAPSHSFPSKITKPHPLSGMMRNNHSGGTGTTPAHALEPQTSAPHVAKAQQDCKEEKPLGKDATTVVNPFGGMMGGFGTGAKPAKNQVKAGVPAQQVPKAHEKMEEKSKINDPLGILEFERRLSSMMGNIGRKTTPNHSHVEAKNPAASGNEPKEVGLKIEETFSEIVDQWKKEKESLSGAFNSFVGGLSRKQTLAKPDANSQVATPSTAVETKAKGQAVVVDGPRKEESKLQTKQVDSKSKISEPVAETSEEAKDMPQANAFGTGKPKESEIKASVINTSKLPEAGIPGSFVARSDKLNQMPERRAIATDKAREAAPERDAPSDEKKLSLGGLGRLKKALSDSAGSMYEASKGKPLTNNVENDYASTTKQDMTTVEQEQSDESSNLGVQKTTSAIDESLQTDIDEAMEAYNKAMAAMGENLDLKEAAISSLKDVKKAKDANKKYQPYEKRVSKDDTISKFVDKLEEPSMMLINLGEKKSDSDKNEPSIVVSNDADMVESVLQDRPKLSKNMFNEVAQLPSAGEEEEETRTEKRHTSVQPEVQNIPNFEDDDILYYLDDDLHDDDLGDKISIRVIEEKPSVTEEILKRTEIMEGYTAWTAFQKLEKEWSELKASKEFSYDNKWMKKVQNGVPPPYQFVADDATWSRTQTWEKLRSQRDKPLDYDVIVVGGSMGLFFARALQLRGARVCVVEGGDLVNVNDEKSEWRTSIDELEKLHELGIITRADIDDITQTSLPGCRVGFNNAEDTTNDGRYECVTKNVMNIGVSPAVLLRRVAQRFKSAGGTILEQTPLMGVAISQYTGAAVDLGEDLEPLSASLIMDCMGSQSPMLKQQRYGMKPDGICAVVGSCAAGFDKYNNRIGDIMYSNSNIQDKGGNGKHQYFWESFPVKADKMDNNVTDSWPGQWSKYDASDMKTTYMYTYMDADQRRPSLKTLMDDYWRMLSDYQPEIKDPANDLDVKRVLFGYFPTYREPLKSGWNRMLPIDIQAPLAFGGFGPMVRHLGRITDAVTDALDNQCLHKEDLAAINAYAPADSAKWLFQKAMAVRMGQKVDPRFINRALATNFAAMNAIGPQAINPFLQDVMRFDTLIDTMARSAIADPAVLPQFVQHVGLPTFFDWLKHVSMMGVYSALDTAVSPHMVSRLENLGPRQQFKWRRRMDAWKVGSGNDYNPQGPKAKK